MDITESEGYKKLLSAVERDELQSPNFHDYRGKLAWILERANHYAEKTGLVASDILDAWEKDRTYWYMNYYQECNQPKIEFKRVKVFDTIDELIASFQKKEFRCPACGGVSSSPYKCTSGKKISNRQVCDWNVGGLLKDMGKGVYVFVKENVRGQTIFMPLAWEE